MAGSVNKVILVGNLGADPDARTMQSGDDVVNLSVATSESWKDKATGEKREKTEWHRVVVFSPGLVGVCKSYLRKGSKVYLEGQLQTRSWEQDGQKKYTTEVVLRGYDAKLVMLDSRSGGGDYASSAPSQDNQSFGGGAPQQQAAAAGGGQAAPTEQFEDEIPF